MTETEKKTILAFAENDMNITKTAKRTYMSIGGIRGRLYKIAEKYKYDPYIFYDLIELVRMAGGKI